MHACLIVCCKNKEKNVPSVKLKARTCNGPGFYIRYNVSVKAYGLPVRLSALAQTRYFSEASHYHCLQYQITAEW